MTTSDNVSHASKEHHHQEDLTLHPNLSSTGRILSVAVQLPITQDASGIFRVIDGNDSCYNDKIARSDEVLLYLSSMKHVQHTILGWVGKTSIGTFPSGYDSMRSNLVLSVRDHFATDVSLAWMEDPSPEVYPVRRSSHTVDTEALEGLKRLVLEIYQTGDLIWIHDKDLLLLACGLRERLPTVQICHCWDIGLPMNEERLQPGDLTTLVNALANASILGFTEVETRKRFESLYLTLDKQNLLRNNPSIPVKYEDTVISVRQQDLLNWMPTILDIDASASICGQNIASEVKGITTHFLRQASAVAAELTSISPFTALPIADMCKQFVDSQKRLLMFDYDGTLTSIVNDPNKALPSEKLMATLTRLCEEHKNSIWIISGRSRLFLEATFGHITGLGLSAEHGSLIRQPNSTEWRNLAAKMPVIWKKVVNDAFEDLTGRVEHSWIERKEVAIVWHYRNAADHHACLEQAQQCKSQLQTRFLDQNWNMEVMLGKANLEVRPKYFSKGSMVADLVKKLEVDSLDKAFVLCAGDDTTDEDMFRALLLSDMPLANMYRCLVSKTELNSLATYRVDEPSDLVDILAKLATADVRPREVEVHEEEDEHRYKKTMKMSF